MSDLKFCPRCGSDLVSGERFCGECGFDTYAPADSKRVPAQPAEGTAAPVAPAPQPDLQVAPPPASYPPPVQPPAAIGPTTGNNRAVVILIAILAVVFLGGGGAYWWLSRNEKPSHSSQVATSASGNGSSAVKQQSNATQSSDTQKAEKPDLTRADTYLSEPGLKCQFFANYPDGTSGNVERISALVVPAEAVRVSEAEISSEGGESYGSVMHYVERADGIYSVYDQTPQEIMPVLKNNLTTGQTWNCQDEFGQIVWTVMDMGVTLDLGFTKLENCLLVQEDNQAVGYKSIVYYAPGMGRVAEKSSLQGGDLFKLTAFSHVDKAQAADAVKKWAPNYATIHDDRTQS